MTQPARKPHIRLLPKSEAPSRESAVDAERRRFGQKFAHEKGNTFQPRQTPLLTAWLASRVKDGQS